MRLKYRSLFANYGTPENIKIKINWQQVIAKLSNRCCSVELYNIIVVIIAVGGH